MQPPVILSLLVVTLRTVIQHCSFMSTAGPPWVSVLVSFIKSRVEMEAVHCVGMLPPPTYITIILNQSCGQANFNSVLKVTQTGLPLANETNLVHAFILSVFYRFYLYPLHVSDLSRSIIRRNNYLCDTWYLLFCTADSLVCRHTRLSAVQNNKYLASHKYSFLLMMDLERSKTCRCYKQNMQRL